jgi:hypothetical protein
MNSWIIYAVNEKLLLSAPLIYYLQPRLRDYETMKENPDCFSLDSKSVAHFIKLVPDYMNASIGALGSFDILCSNSRIDNNGYLEDLLYSYVTQDSPYILGYEMQEVSAGVISGDLELLSSPDLSRWVDQQPSKPFNLVVSRKDFAFFIPETRRIIDRLGNLVKNGTDPDYFPNLLSYCDPMVIFMEKMAVNKDVDYLILDLY